MAHALPSALKKEDRFQFFTWVTWERSWCQRGTELEIALPTSPSATASSCYCPARHRALSLCMTKGMRFSLKWKNTPAGPPCSKLSHGWAKRDIGFLHSSSPSEPSSRADCSHGTERSHSTNATSIPCVSAYSSETHLHAGGEVLGFRAACLSSGMVICRVQITDKVIRLRSWPNWGIFFRNGRGLLRRGAEGFDLMPVVPDRWWEPSSESFPKAAGGPGTFDGVGVSWWMCRAILGELRGVLGVTLDGSTYGEKDGAHIPFSWAILLAWRSLLKSLWGWHVPLLHREPDGAT